MGLYSAAKYGVDAYGQFSKIDYYAEPFISKAVDYTKVQLTWVEPSGDNISEFRILRSNDGFPETPEDGRLIYSYTSSTNIKLTDYLDGEEPLNPVPSGKFVYYRIWVKVLSATNVWRVAGDTFTLVPIKHSSLAPDQTTLVDTKNKLLDILPRVYTTSTQSPIDEVDPNSELAIFLDAFAFELDIALTYADLLLPTDTWQYVSPEILTLQSAQFGIELEPYIATKQQRKLVRNAVSINKNKGTLRGIESFVESYTGFAPTVTSSPNLVLSTQDSTFTKGVGFWKAIGNATIATEITVPGVSESIEPYVENNGYVAKITINTIGSKIVNGNEKPVTQGTPVFPGTAYTFSGYGRSASGDIGVKGYVTWYDINGNYIEIDPPRTFIQTPQLIGDSDWERFEFVGRSPGVTDGILAYSINSGALTFYLESINSLVRGETIVVSGISTAINGIYQIAANGITPETINQLTVLTAEANTSGLVSCDGLLQEANPEIETFDPLSPVAGRVVMGGAIVSGVATVTFAGAHGLNVGDKIIVQAMSTAFSFGVHTITAKTTNTVTFQIYNPYTPIPNTTLNESFSVTSVPYGFAVKLIAGEIQGIVPDAYYASFELEFATTGTLYLDLLQMATFDVPEYHQPRAVEIFLNPNKTNFLPQPGIVSPSGTATITIASPSVVTKATHGLSNGQKVFFTTTGALPTGITANNRYYVRNATTNTFNLSSTLSGSLVATSGTQSGIHSLLKTTWDVTATDYKAYNREGTSGELVDESAALTGAGFVLLVDETGGNDAVVEATSAPLNTGKFVTASVYLKAYGTTTGDLTLSLEAIDSADDSLLEITSETQVTLTDSWERYSTTLFIPTDDRETIVVKMSLVSDGNIKFWLDRAQVEESFRPTDYFAGSDVAGEASAESAFWEGAQYGSPSHQYANFDQKIDRLRAQLPNYLPTNLSFLIRWYGGGVAKPII
jgi:hypothetical protein